MSKRDPSGSGESQPSQMTSVSITVPLAAEDVKVETRRSERGRVRVFKTVDTERRTVTCAGLRRDVLIEHVPINQFVERPGQVRHEGDTLVIPVHEEVPVVVMRTRLKEEIRITTRTMPEEHRIPVTVRRERIAVERVETRGGHETNEQGRSICMNTIIGLFETRAQAQRTQSALAAIPIPASDVSLYDQSAGQSPGDTERGFWESLKDTFGFGEDRSSYEEGIRRGGTLVSVRAGDDQLERIVDIMSSHGAVDIDERATEWRGSDAPGADTSTVAGSMPAPARDATMPVVEEQLQVGKRDVRRGKVRVYRRVTEQPVEETIRLRDEQVRVERRPVDRPVTEDAGLFANETFEFVETDEEPVVSKQARVVEEVAVQKDVQDREQTIRDTVRRADVQVEREEADRATAESGIDDEECRRHWTATYGSGDVPYEQFGPAYRFGAQLGGGRNAESADWSQLEPDARRRWETTNQGTWDQFKDAVRHSWERSRQKQPDIHRRAA